MTLLDIDMLPCTPIIEALMRGGSVTRDCWPAGESLRLVPYGDGSIRLIRTYRPVGEPVRYERYELCDNDRAADDWQVIDAGAGDGAGRQYLSCPPPVERSASVYPLE